MTSPRFHLLYVCNGDNARAPLAAAYTRRVTGRASGLTWVVDSAGTEADEPVVRDEAAAAGAAIDVDISTYLPKLLTSELCDAPDLILAMSWEQVSQIWSLVPAAWDKVFTVKEFIHWATKAPVRPPILFADPAEAMRDKIQQAHAIRKRARADYGFWGGIRPQDLNLIEPIGKGDEAWTTLAHAVQAVTNDVVTLLTGPEVKPVKAVHAPKRPRSRAKAKAKARR